MKTLLLGIALTALAIGCGAADGATNEPKEESSSAINVCPAWGCSGIPKFGCDSATCTAGGGTCDGTGPFSLCQKGCENPPTSCTATVSGGQPFGYINIQCASIGNGVYEVNLTDAPPINTVFGPSAPNGPWIPYSNYGAGNQQWVFNGTPVAPATIDEDDLYLPACHNGFNPPGCQIHATYVQICAVPGAGQFNEQSGICGDSFAKACTVVPVVYR